MLPEHSLKPEIASGDCLGSAVAAQLHSTTACT